MERVETWTTEDEINWLKKIGKSCRKPVKPLSTFQRLRLYYKSIDRRADWRGIDKEKIRRFVFDRLEDMMNFLIKA